MSSHEEIELEDVKAANRMTPESVHDQFMTMFQGVIIGTCHCVKGSNKSDHELGDRVQNFVELAGIATTCVESLQVISLTVEIDSVAKLDLDQNLRFLLRRFFPALKSFALNTLLSRNSPVDLQVPAFLSLEAREMMSMIRRIVDEELFR